MEIANRQPLSPFFVGNPIYYGSIFENRGYSSDSEIFKNERSQHVMEFNSFFHPAIYLAFFGNRNHDQAQRIEVGTDLRYASIEWVNWEKSAGERSLYMTRQARVSYYNWGDGHYWFHANSEACIFRGISNYINNLRYSPDNAKIYIDIQARLLKETDSYNSTWGIYLRTRTKLPIIAEYIDGINYNPPKSIKIQLDNNQSKIKIGEIKIKSGWDDPPLSNTITLVGAVWAVDPQHAEPDWYLSQLLPEDYPYNIL